MLCGAFIADQKRKEIGIRKVLGATVARIVATLNKSFIKWVLMANILAWPAAYFVMNKWLQNFAYRIDLSWWMFVLAAIRNPVDSLRYE